MLVLSGMATKLGTAAPHREAVVKALLAAGADANVTNKAGMTPINLATTNKHVEEVKVLQAAKGLMYYEIVCLFNLFHMPFVNLDAALIDGRSALKHACVHGRTAYILPMVQHCLAKGAHVTGSFAAVGSALIDRPDLVLACLAAWPECMREVTEELNSRVFSRRQSVLVGLTKNSAVQLAAAVTTALVPPRGLPGTRVANVHICGEPGAGKFMTLQALRRTVSCSWLKSLPKSEELPHIDKEDGRTLGMESCEENVVVDDMPIKINLYDYGGQVYLRVSI